MAYETQQRVYRALINGYVRMVSAMCAKETDAQLRYQQRLNLDHLKTFADKVSWIELNTDRTSAARCTDKWEVCGYIADKGLPDLLVPAVGDPWLDTDEIDFGHLPGAFVLKATHRSFTTVAGGMFNNFTNEFIAKWGAAHQCSLGACLEGYVDEA